MMLKSFFKNLNKDFNNKSFNGFEFNSKKIKKNYIFFAIQGSKFNGNNFINDAIIRGARIIVSNKFKTGTAQKSIKGKYSKKKVNTFASIFPISDPKYVLIVLLDEPKLSETYIYEYYDGKKRNIVGTPFNTAGWTSVEVAKSIIEKIGPILAIKY